jgi:hypothetical protein
MNPQALIPGWISVPCCYHRIDPHRRTCMSKGSVNKVILIGNLGGDPDSRTISNGLQVATLSLATTDCIHRPLTDLTA